MDMDMNWWGLYAMPVGLLLCFGPVLVAWVMDKSDDAPAAKSKKKH